MGKQEAGGSKWKANFRRSLLAVGDDPSKVMEREGDMSQAVPELDESAKF